jgi:hypothetical protein
MLETGKKYRMNGLLILDRTNVWLNNIDVQYIGTNGTDKDMHMFQIMDQSKDAINKEIGEIVDSGYHDAETGKYLREFLWGESSGQIDFDTSELQIENDTIQLVEGE